MAWSKEDASKPVESGFADDEGLWDPSDVGRAVETLHRHFASRALVGYLDGKTDMRDALLSHHPCSATEAELMVDRLENQGFIRYPGDPGSLEEMPEAWVIEPPSKLSRW